MAVPYVTTPVDEMAWSIPTDADELCMMAVSTSPIKIPSNGLLNDVNRFWKLSDSLSGANTPLHGIHAEKEDSKTNKNTCNITFLVVICK